MYTTENPEDSQESAQEYNNIDAEYQETDNRGRSNKIISIFAPVLFAFYLLTSLAYIQYSYSQSSQSDGFVEVSNTEKETQFSLLSSEELMSPIKDTVYTDKDVWIELRIDQQHVYQHWRDGRVLKYPVSSGNKFVSKGIESRPGLFAIFYKNEHHKSSQFDDASLFHFMTFNQGIGFHSLSGTGYYSLLGVRPASHGCIRMRHEDAKKMFEDCEMGTLVLATNGYSSRTIAFAPKGYKKEDIPKEEMKGLLAKNLKNVLEGNYFTAPRKYFVVDPAVIPMSGVYISYDKQIPKKQKLPVYLYSFQSSSDRLEIATSNIQISTSENYAAGEITEKPTEKYISNQPVYENEAEIIKKYFHNPIGILPYFPPTKKAPKVSTYISTTSGSESGDQ